MTLSLSRLHLALLGAGGLAAICLSGIPAATAAGKFDGNWSVVVITESGACDRAYRYPVKVVQGTLKYDSESGIAITGKVDDNGRIKASIRRGEQQANGTGRLTQNAGAGTWVGKGSASECSGRWEAERRDG